MNSPDVFVALCIALALAGICTRRHPRTLGWIVLPESRFWKLVATAERPLVVLAARGFIRRRICYIHARDGFTFYTWNRPPDLPEDVVLVPATEVTPP